jgi:hypothetical protein
MTEPTDIAKKIAIELLPYFTSPRWLKLKQACLYSAIGKKRLKQLAESGDVVGFHDPDSKRGDWIFDRISLDEYRLGQANEIEKKAVAFLRGVK